MRMLLRLAWRNVWRHPARSRVVVATVAIGLFVALFMTAFYQGVAEQRIRNTVRHDLSHLQLHHPDFPADHDPAFLIHGADSLVDALLARPGVAAVAPRMVLMGMVQSPTAATGLRINGVDPELEDRTTGLGGAVVEGEWFGPGRSNGILISANTARRLNVRLRGKVVVMAQAPSGEIASAAFRVQGIHRTVNGLSDDANVYITRADAAAMLGVDDAVHEVAVLLHHNELVEAEAAALRAARPGLLVRTWTELSPEMDLLVNLFDAIIFALLGIIFAALAFGLVNTMLMAVLERQREIGMLVSIGMGRGRVFAMVVLETLLVVLAGVPIGGLLAWGVITWGAAHGMRLGVYSDTLQDFGYDPLVYPSLTAYHVAVLVLMVVTLTLLAALYPAAKALTLKTAEAIRK